MTFKKLFESYREYTLSEDDMGVVDQYKIRCLLTVTGRTDRKKEDILSDIRAVQGVTIVNILHSRDTEMNEFSEMIMKINTSPFGSASIFDILKVISRDIKKLDGVTTFKYISEPVGIEAD